jgi:hypothetical protein
MFAGRQCLCSDADIGSSRYLVESVVKDGYRNTATTAKISAPLSGRALHKSSAGCNISTVISGGSRGQSSGQEPATMKITLAITALLSFAITSAAEARGGTTRFEWSKLSAETLQELPPQISSAIRSAQKACGDDEPRVRTGFLRYLKLHDGQEFVSLHFDQFYCTRFSALCSSAGCMHRVFLADGRGRAREVWHAEVHEIGMDDRAGRPALNVNCDDFCGSPLLWDGSRFSK